MSAKNQPHSSDVSGSKPRKRARTRQKIIDITMSLVNERGYDDVSVTEIARVAGITAPTFYNHFTGKDAVLGDILLDQHIGWARLVEERMNAEDSALVKLRALTSRNARGLLASKRLFKALIRHAKVPPGHVADDQRAGQQIDHSLDVLIRKGQETGEISIAHSAELLEMILRAAETAIQIKWAHGEISDDELEFTQLEALELVVRGPSDS